MFALKKSIIILIILCLSFGKLEAQASKEVPLHFCISQQEYILFNMINDYRAKLALDAIPLSKSLCYVAKTHAKDLSENFPMAKACNMHSWSDKGDWKAFCFPKDQSRKNDIKDKAKELTAYPGKAWEITYWENADLDLASILDFWNSIPYTGDMISNTKKWASRNWKSMGVGIQDGYVLVWFGQKEDPEPYTLICETGEKVLYNPEKPLVMAAAIGQSSNTTAAYYIIIGSFNQKSDALTTVNSYKQMGYAHVEVIESDGRLRVSIDKYKTHEGAEKALVSYKDKFRGAWIFSKQ